GVDGDGDGELDDDEISDATTLCHEGTALECSGGKMIDGPITIVTADDQAKLEGITCIDGDLVIVSTDLFALPSLGALETVTGHVVIAGNPILASLDDLERLHVV